jgi:hypothetical protein
LAVRLRDPEIRDIIQTIIAGATDPDMAETDTFALCMDLGLVAMNRGTPEIANPIYREVIARQITYGQQSAIPEPNWQWEKPDGSLDMDTLLKEFQKFWRRHADRWEEKSDYTEAFPHLLLMAFLQRVLNGGGNIDRECAAGRGRMDLGVEYRGHRYIIEIKLLDDHDGLATVREEGLEQIRQYRDKFSDSPPAYLTIFDRHSSATKKPWDERIYWEYDGDVAIVGC